MIDYKNPYIVSIGAGILIYALNTSKSFDTKQSEKQIKDIKQTRLNHSFLAAISVFLIMQYYTADNTGSIEPVLTTKYDE